MTPMREGRTSLIQSSRNSSESLERKSQINSNIDLTSKVKELLRSNQQRRGISSRSIDRFINNNREKKAKNYLTNGSKDIKEHISANPYQSIEGKLSSLANEKTHNRGDALSQSQNDNIRVTENDWRNSTSR